jgi:hypothetical protein
MPKRLHDYFPTVQSLISASVFDVANVVVELISESDRVIAPNSISAWTDQYERLTNEQQTAVRRVLSEAWSWLHVNGVIAEDITPGGGPNYWFITRGAEASIRSGDLKSYAKASLLPLEILDPAIEQVARRLFLGGHFDAAVAAAFIEIEIFVRRVTNSPDDLVGVPLMRKAFHTENGPLTIPEAAPAEREAVQHLFSGAIGYYKNPFSHRRVGIARAVQAASLILTANELYITAKTHAALAEKRKTPT